MCAQRNVSLLYLCVGSPVRLLYQPTHTQTHTELQQLLYSDNYGPTKKNLCPHLFCKGFGSFVEKTVMPYISTTPAKLLNPCTGDQNCTSPFSYKNVLKLTSDGKKFNTLVGQQQISGNLDSPEGGFDAIMQVAVCEVSSTRKPLLLLRESVRLQLQQPLAVLQF